MMSPNGWTSLDISAPAARLPGRFALPGAFQRPALLLLIGP